MIEIRKIEEVRRGVDIPEITGIYDPLSGKKDGTITPMAPLVVWGRNLRHYALEDFKLKDDEGKVYVLPAVWVVRGRWRR